MRKVRKTALVLCLGTLAISGVLTLPASADETNTIGQAISAEETLVVEAPAAAIDDVIIGAASYYDDPQETASGEFFDPDSFTAAAQLEIRDRFGGIRFGMEYRPAFAVAEYENKKIIVKFNDVGPLVPGRKFDLSRAAMAYFGGLDKGVLPDVKVRPLPIGEIFPPGPVTDADLADLGIAEAGFATAAAPDAQEQNVLDSRSILPLEDGATEIDAG